MNQNRIELDLTAKAMELVNLYRRYNPKGNYLNISYLQTGDHTGRIHINNAFYDRDHGHPVDIKHDMYI